VYVWVGGFNKTGGVIYGSDEGDPLKKNTTNHGDTCGHGVLYIGIGSYYYRDATLNDTDNISTGRLPGSGAGYGWTKGS
jgi:hypothetical protein